MSILNYDDHTAKMEELKDKPEELKEYITKREAALVQKAKDEEASKTKTTGEKQPGQLSEEQIQELINKGVADGLGKVTSTLEEKFQVREKTAEEIAAEKQKKKDEETAGLTKEQIEAANEEDARKKAKADRKAQLQGLKD